MKTIWLCAVLLASSTLACAGAPPPAAAPPSSPQQAAPSGATNAVSEVPTKSKMGDPFVLGAPIADDPPAVLEAKDPDFSAWASVAQVAGVPAAPPECAAFAHRAAPKRALACDEKGVALSALADALDQVDVAQRDVALVSLESCGGLPKGLVRALRADLAPHMCSDAIVDPLLVAAQRGNAKLPGVLAHTLVGQSIGARLARTVAKAPPMKGPTRGAADKKQVLAYVTGPLRQWIEEQARAIETLSRAASGLTSYGRGLAAVEAGLADMRFVARAREVPLPKEFETDEELKTAYYAALDQALDPRKDRGRDAALVGLRELAALGIVQDAHVARARALLAQLYAGRRIDALDALLTPPPPPVSRVTVEERLAAKLPTFYAALLFDGATLTQPSMLRASLTQGVPPAARAAAMSGASTPLPAESRLLYARGRVELGKTYFRAVDFDAAARAADPVRTSGGGTAAFDEATLYVALGAAFHEGPRDAVALMHAASPAALGLRDVAALDAVKGRAQGDAEHDAALLLSIAPPDGATKSYFDDVARRFHAAASRLEGAEKGLADERARAAEQVAAAAPSR